MAETTYGTNLFLEGRLPEAVSVFTRARENHLQSDYQPIASEFGVDARTLFWSQFSRALACQGLRDTANAQPNAARARADYLQHRPSIAISLSATCTTAWIMRDMHALAERSSALISLADEQGFSFWLARGQCYVGWVASQEGHLGKAFSLLNAGISALRAAGIILYIPAAYAMLSDAYRLAGDQNAAIEALNEGIGIAAKTGELWCEAELYRLQGELQAGNRGAAEQLLQRALDTARRQSARLWELRAGVSLARLWLHHGSLEAARNLLAPIFGEFSSDGDSADHREASTLLAEID